MRAISTMRCIWSWQGTYTFLVTREKFKSAMADLVSRGAESIILGCTEFGLLVQAEAAVEFALDDGAPI